MFVCLWGLYLSLYKYGQTFLHFQVKKCAFMSPTQEALLIWLVSL